jgi:hypothetical protein
MLVAISGSQGSGKTTVLSKLEEAGFPIIKRKTSRSLLDEWGVTLDDVLKDPELTVKFQDEIIERKYKDEREEYLDTQSRRRCQDPVRIWFTERTYADAFVYALIYLGKNNEHSQWINEYYSKCENYSQTYDYVFYLKAGHFSIEHDGVRGSNQHYGRMVDITLMDVTKQMVLPNRISTIETPNLGQRVSTIIRHSLSMQDSVY